MVVQDVLLEHQPVAAGVELNDHRVAVQCAVAVGKPGDDDVVLGQSAAGDICVSRLLLVHTHLALHQLDMPCKYPRALCTVQSIQHSPRRA